MSSVPAAPVLAAGAVCWREGRNGVEILLIQRPRHDDVSLPKGKVDPGETVPEAAVREIREETGFSVGLGVPLGTTEYNVGAGRPKVVYYWAAHVSRDQLKKNPFRPNDEVETVEWVSPEEARTRLTYERDIDVVDRFARLVERDHHETFAIIALRHAKAESDSPDGTDASRELTNRGRQQAAGLAGSLAAWAPSALLSSPARRCLDTVGPLGEALRLEVKPKRSLSQELWEGRSADSDAPARLKAHVAKRIERKATVVMCTHSPVLPTLLDTVAAIVGGERDGRFTRAAILSTAEFTVIHLASRRPNDGVIALESHSPLR